MGTPRRMRAVFAVALLSLCLLPSLARADEVSPAAIQNQRCLACHGQSHIGTVPLENRRVMVIAATQPVAGDPEGARPSLYIQEQPLAGSVHKNIACVS